MNYSREKISIIQVYITTSSSCVDRLIDWSKKYLDSHNNAAATDDVHAAAAAGVVHSSSPVCLGHNTDLPQNSAAAADDAEEERVRRNDEPGLGLPHTVHCSLAAVHTCRRILDTNHGSSVVPGPDNLLERNLRRKK